MSKLQNRGGISIFGTAEGLGDVSGPGSSTNNSVARFDGATGKLIKGSGNNVTFDDTTFAIRDNSGNMLFAVDVVSQDIRFDLGETNSVAFTHDGEHLNLGFTAVASVFSLSHTGPDNDLLFEIFELGQPEDANTSSIVFGWDESENAYVIKSIFAGTGTQFALALDFPNVSINTPSPDASAVFEVSSTTQGELGARMTTAQRDAISAPATGLWIYNTDTNLFNFFDGTGWEVVSAGISADTINVTFSEAGNLTTGSFLKIGEITCNGTPAWVAPFDYDLKKISIARTDTDAADIEILVAGIVVDTVATAATAVTAILTGSVSEGEGVCVRNKATGNTMSNVIVTLILGTV